MCTNPWLYDRFFVVKSFSPMLLLLKKRSYITININIAKFLNRLAEQWILPIKVKLLKRTNSVKQLRNESNLKKLLQIRVYDCFYYLRSNVIILFKYRFQGNQKISSKVSNELLKVFYRYSYHYIHNKLIPIV